MILRRDGPTRDEVAAEEIGALLIMHVPAALPWIFTVACPTSGTSIAPGYTAGVWSETVSGMDRWAAWWIAMRLITMHVPSDLTWEFKWQVPSR